MVQLVYWIYFCTPKIRQLGWNYLVTERSSWNILFCVNSPFVFWTQFYCCCHLIFLVPSIFVHTDLRKKLDQLESPGLEESITEEKSHEVEKEIEDPTEAYVRELLVASGYYDSSCNQYLSKWDSVGKPISNQVFEEVEESYRQSTKVDENSTKDQGAKINNRLIFDLLNEALLTALRQPANISRARKAIESVHCPPPHGRELLSLVWEIIRSYVHHPADRSCYVLDSMLAQDLKSDLWSGLMDDDINALGKDLECQITGDLIEELVKDIFLLLT